MSGKRKKKSLVGWMNRNWRDYFYFADVGNIPYLHKEKNYLATKKVRITIEEIT